MLHNMERDTDKGGVMERSEAIRIISEESCRGCKSNSGKECISKSLCYEAKMEAIRSMQALEMIINGGEHGKTEEFV